MSWGTVFTPLVGGAILLALALVFGNRQQAHPTLPIPETPSSRALVTGIQAFVESHGSTLSWRPTGAEKKAAVVWLLAEPESGHQEIAVGTAWRYFTLDHGYLVGGDSSRYLATVEVDAPEGKPHVRVTHYADPSGSGWWYTNMRSKPPLVAGWDWTRARQLFECDQDADDAAIFHATASYLQRHGFSSTTPADIMPCRAEPAADPG